MLYPAVRPGIQIFVNFNAVFMFVSPPEVMMRLA